MENYIVMYYIEPANMHLDFWKRLNHVDEEQLVIQLKDWNNCWRGWIIGDTVDGLGSLLKELNHVDEE